MGTLFGTDGVRGIANRDLTAELAYRLGRAGAHVLKGANPRPRVVIGKDTRLSGDMLEAALVAGICSLGADVDLLGVVSTPGVAYLTRYLGADAGVVISASHNPAEYNGIKFFSRDGYKLPDEVEESMETLAVREPDSLPRPTGACLGRTRRAEAAVEGYLDFLAGSVEGDLRGVKVVVDCAHGAACRIAPAVLSRLGAEVVVINAAPDGTNINLGCGSTHPEGLQEAVLREGAHAGLAHDGDADRVIAVDEKGRVVDGDQIMAICGLEMIRTGRLAENTLVATVMSNLGLELAIRRAGGRVVRTRVGDRYVLEEMRARGFNLGGEQSGHIIFLDHTTTGDGVLTALQLLRVMRDRGEPLSVLAAQMERFPQVLWNVRVRDKEAFSQALSANGRIARAIEEVEAELGAAGRVVVRPSGTEPLVRIMLEGADAGRLEALARQLVGVIEQELSRG